MVKGSIRELMFMDRDLFNRNNEAKNNIVGDNTQVQNNLCNKSVLQLVL